MNRPQNPRGATTAEWILLIALLLGVVIFFWQTIMPALHQRIHNTEGAVTTAGTNHAGSGDEEDTKKAEESESNSSWFSRWFGGNSEYSSGSAGDTRGVRTSSSTY